MHQVAHINIGIRSGILVVHSCSVYVEGTPVNADYVAIRNAGGFFFTAMCHMSSNVDYSQASPGRRTEPGEVQTRKAIIYACTCSLTSFCAEGFLWCSCFFSYVRVSPAFSTDTPTRARTTSCGFSRAVEQAGPHKNVGEMGWEGSGEDRKCVEMFSFVKMRCLSIGAYVQCLCAIQ